MADGSILTNVTAITGGSYHTTVLKSDGTVWSWGLNTHGQLGDGTNTDWSHPVQVMQDNATPFGNVKKIVGGCNHTLDLKNDGTLWAWGWNGNGQLGDGTTVDCNNPRQVMADSVTPLANVITMGAGGFHSISLRQDGSIWSWGYNSFGQLADATSLDRSYPVQAMKVNVSYINDAAGDRTGKSDKDSWVYTYDGESRLTQVAKNGADILANSYDGNGMRVKEVKNGQTTYTVYYGVNPLFEYSADDGKYTYFIYAGNKMVAEEKEGVVRYYHKDHLGSTRLVTDGSGAVVASYKFKPYGETESSSGTFSTDYGFTGKPLNADTGLSYFGARWYDPETGRFITADTYTNLPNDERILFGIYGNEQERQSRINQILSIGLGNSQEYNQYSYCLNNPIGNTDSNGHEIDAGTMNGIMYGLEGAGVTISMLTGVGEVALGVTCITVGGYLLYQELTKPQEVSKDKDKSGTKEYKKSKSGVSGKEGAKDVPSWAKGNKPYKDESGSDFAKRLCDEKYGQGNYKTGPGSEYSQIKKWGDRSFE